jgi:hypothetical protein
VGGPPLGAAALKSPVTRTSVLAAAVALWTATLVPAVAVPLWPGLGERGRQGFGFRLVPQPGTQAELVSIAWTNGRVVLAVTLAAWSAARLVALRPILDTVVAGIIGLNATLVGVALGAYGSAALPWLVHLPFEWTALSVVLALYCTGRDERLSAARVVASALTALALVGIGAAVEVYLTPQR